MDHTDGTGKYNVERLMAEHGDAKLTVLLQTLADCPKARSVSIYDRCRAVYEGLGTRLRSRPLSVIQRFNVLCDRSQIRI